MTDYSDDAYRRAARAGDIEYPIVVHDASPVRHEDDQCGRYVQAWVWVHDEAAAAHAVTCALCDAPIHEGGMSSPVGSIHVQCSLRHEQAHPEQW